MTEPLKLQVLDLLRLGLSDEIIRREAIVNAKTLGEIKKYLKKSGKITDEKIEKAREKRDREVKETTYALLMQGYNYREIAEQIPYTAEKYISRITQILKQEGKVTDEEIERAKFDRYEKRKMEVVLQCLKRGLSYKETAGFDKSLGLTEQQYVTCKKKLIESGAITKEKIEEQRELANKRKKAERAEEYEGPLDKEIIRLTKKKMKAAEIAKKLGVVESYVSARKKAIKKKQQQKKKGVSKEEFADCFRQAQFTEEQIQRILKKELNSILKRASISRINKVLRVLLSYQINREAIVNCLSVLVVGKASELEGILVVLKEHKISQLAIEGALSVIASGKAENVRRVFEVLDECKIEKSKIEGCLSILVVVDANAIRDIIKILMAHGVEKETITNSLYTVATSRLSNIQNIFDKLQKYNLEADKVLRRGIKMLAEGDADDIEKIILTLQENGVKNEVIAEELSAIVNSSTPEEVAFMFHEQGEPKDKETHYIHVRRYMKLKELYGRAYTREEIEKLCAQKHLGVREFISEVVTYPRGKEFTDIYYERLMNEGTLYVGSSTDIDRDYQEEHGEELIKLSKKVANTFALRTRYKDRTELEGKALEIILTKCGNLVYNLSHQPDKLKAAMFNKAISYLYSVKNDGNTSSLTAWDRYENGKEGVGQRDIPVEDNTDLYDEPVCELEGSINYEKAKFDQQETQVMKCMIKLVEERRSGSFNRESCKNNYHG